jgi:hypothetical protein
LSSSSNENIKMCILTLFSRFFGSEIPIKIFKNNVYLYNKFDEGFDWCMNCNIYKITNPLQKNYKFNRSSFPSYKIIQFCTNIRPTAPRGHGKFHEKISKIDFFVELFSFSFPFSKRTKEPIRKSFRRNP